MKKERSRLFISLLLMIFLTHSCTNYVTARYELDVNNKKRIKEADVYINSKLVMTILYNDKEEFEGLSNLDLKKEKREDGVYSLGKEVWHYKNGVLVKLEVYKDEERKDLLEVQYLSNEPYYKTIYNVFKSYYEGNLVKEFAIIKGKEELIAEKVYTDDTRRKLKEKRFFYLGGTIKTKYFYDTESEKVKRIIHFNEDESIKNIHDKVYEKDLKNLEEERIKALRSAMKS